MKIVIFAGGVGTRLWPLSRKNTPKQFEKIFGDKSTLQETVERLYPDFKPEDIFISTGGRYEKIVREQLPQIPHDNFIFEPEMRDVGPAIGLVTALLEKKFPDEPMGILWSDHLVKDTEKFRTILKTAEQKIREGGATFIFLGQKPRFANQNIGWIELGDEVEPLGSDIKLYEFKKLRYRPELADAQRFAQDEKFAWNLGYFVTTPRFLSSLFKEFAADMYSDLQKISISWGGDSFKETLKQIYPSLEKISFDNAILEKLDPSKMYVISADLGWSDVGAWEALKEALSDTEDQNVEKGKVLLEDSKDCLAFNYTDQLVVGIDLSEMLVISTKDVVLVCPKTSVPKIKKLVESLAGTPHEHLT